MDLKGNPSNQSGNGNNNNAGDSSLNTPPPLNQGVGLSSSFDEISIMSTSPGRDARGSLLGGEEQVFMGEGGAGGGAGGNLVGSTVLPKGADPLSLIQEEEKSPLIYNPVKKSPGRNNRKGQGKGKETKRSEESEVVGGGSAGPSLSVPSKEDIVNTLSKDYQETQPELAGKMTSPKGDESKGATPRSTSPYPRVGSAGGSRSGSPMSSLYPDMPPPYEKPTAPVGGGGGEEGSAGNISTGSNAGMAAAAAGLFGGGEMFSDIPLEVTVGEPLQQGSGFSKYTSYLITTQTKRPNFHAEQFSQRRRYTDFIILRDFLLEKYPACIIPPLPGKKIGPFDPDFILVRLRGLERFLKRVCCHPLLSNEEQVKHFLEHDYWRNTLRTLPASSTLSIDSRTWRKFMASAMVVVKPDHRYSEVGLYARQLQSSSRNTQRALEALISSSFRNGAGDLFSHYADLGPICTAASHVEVDLGHDFRALGHSLQQMSVLQRAFSLNCEVVGVEFFKEYYGFSEAITNCLKYRDFTQYEFDLVAQKTDDLRREKESVSANPPGISFKSIMGKDPSKVKRETLSDLTEKIAKFEAESVQLIDRRNITCDVLVAEMQHFHTQKKKDFKKAMIQFADVHIRYNKECLSVWDDLVLTLDRVK
eukprot:Nk52_evm23s136 gene=Nk52_evmTU23s136